jgi:hypothetical protein
MVIVLFWRGIMPKSGDSSRTTQDYVQLVTDRELDSYIDDHTDCDGMTHVHQTRTTNVTLAAIARAQAHGDDPSEIYDRFGVI